MKKTLIMVVIVVVMIGIMQPQMVAAAEWPKDVPLPGQMLSLTIAQVRDFAKKSGLVKRMYKVEQKITFCLFQSKTIELTVKFDSNGVVDEESFHFWKPYLTVEDIMSIPGFGDHYYFSEDRHFGDRYSVLIYRYRGIDVKNFRWIAEIYGPKPGKYINALIVSKKL